MNVGPKVGVGRRGEVFEWGDDTDGMQCVLKLFNEGTARESVEREWRFARAASEAGIPTPKVHGEVVEHDGCLGVLYERVEGHTLEQLLLTRMLRSVSRDLADLHYKAHRVSVSGLETQKEHLKRKIEHAPTITEYERSQLEELTNSMPDGDCLCHGDFHPRNIIFRTRREGGPVIIDWENAAVGDAAADVAQTLLLTTFSWRGMPSIPARWTTRWAMDRIYRFYSHRYFELSGMDATRVDRWMTVTAAARITDDIPEEHDHLIQYVRERLAAGL